MTWAEAMLLEPGDHVVFRGELAVVRKKPTSGAVKVTGLASTRSHHARAADLHLASAVEILAALAPPPAPGVHWRGRRPNSGATRRAPRVEEQTRQEGP